MGIKALWVNIVSSHVVSMEHNLDNNRSCLNAVLGVGMKTDQIVQESTRNSFILDMSRANEDLSVVWGD